MGTLLRTVSVIFLVLTTQGQSQQTPPPPAQDLGSVLERCWRAEEIKTSRNSNFSSSNMNFDQKVGRFRGEVHTRWCQTSLEAWGPVERTGNRDHLTRIDSLTLHLRTDTIAAELTERPGKTPHLTVNGRAANVDWWRAGSRERVLGLARLPLP